MSDILDTYLAQLATRVTQRGQRPSPATIRATRADLAGFISWWEQRQRLTFDLTLVMEHDLLDWQEHRQLADGAKPATINRANASLRGLFAWAHAEGMIAHNPAVRLHDLASDTDTAPRSTPPEAVEWLFRLAAAQRDPTARLRDLALLTLLNDCGLRSQEAADLQLRDVDLGGAQLTVRAGKGRKPRRVPIVGESVQRIEHYLAVRCPNGLPAIGSDTEREAFLIGQRADQPGQPWLPGMTTAAQRKRFAELRRAAAMKLRAQAQKERSLVRVGELLELARQLDEASPHRLRHSLAYRLLESGATPAYVKAILGHSRVSTALMYGKPTEQDQRDALARANTFRGRC